MDDEDEDGLVDDCCVPALRLSPSLVTSAVFTFAKDLFTAVADFFDIAAHLLAAHHLYLAQQREMHDQATAEIETLIGE